MENNSIFKKIIKKEIPSEIIYQDEIVTAFKDIKPQAPIHILIIPNILIQTLNEINKKNKNTLAHMLCISIKIAKQKKIDQEGYRIIINCNKNAGQEIHYLHMHLVGGKKLGKFC